MYNQDEDPDKVDGKYDHTPYYVSVDSIESVTGIDFLTTLGDDVETVIENSIQTEIWLDVEP